MDPIVIVLLIILAVIVVGAVVMVAVKKRRRAHLRERFGVEYDRTIDRADNKRSAERDLAEREQVRDQLELRELSAGERDRYREQWELVQSSFVDRPEAAVRDADELVGAVMRDRGYPVDDFDQRADLVSVDHPQVVDHYRHAHAIAVRDAHEDVSTEDRRQAFVHFRALFDILLGAENREHDRV